MSPDRVASVSQLPAEILIRIAGSLASLGDVLTFASVCSRWRVAYQDNTWDIARNVVPRCIGCESEAWTLLSVQEDVPFHTIPGYSMTPRLLVHMARNARKLENAKQWFNIEVMKQIRPERDWCIEVWGTPKRPPHMTKTEQLRFERAYYLAASLMEPKGRHLMNTIVLRHLYYVYDITFLNFSVGEDVMGDQGETDQRTQLRRDCRARMEELWDKFLPDRDLKSRNTLALGPDAFGCYCSHLTMFDHYQSQIRTELLPKQRWSVDTDTKQEDLDQYIWGPGRYDDTDT
ncbi:hypothetical protein HJFPF1_02200 [Paramyrothecium foliicola]|nr:hypothetical protein HJFPF1_02200 [Paramyrothecium foliicola]